MANRKFYVVWNGHHTGVYDSWEECKLQVTNFPEARYKSFPSQKAAIAAYRGETMHGELDLIKSISSHKPAQVKYADIPEIDLDSIAVDAACSGNPGLVEYRGVSVRTGQQIFHVGPLEGGSNNMGEFLALVHALALLDKKGLRDMKIYSDSKTGMAWVRNGAIRTKIAPTPENAPIRNLIDRALHWLHTHPGPRNPILKWDTEKWGEIPADFGRK